MKNLMFILLILTALPAYVVAQSPNVKMTITVLYGRVTANPVDHESGIDPRWRLYYNNVLRAIVTKDNITATPWYEINSTIITDQVVQLNGSFNLGIEAWEEDNACGSNLSYNDCGFLGDDDDEYCGLTNTTIGNIGTMRPGHFNILNYPSNNVVVVRCGIYELQLLITYGPSAPSAPIIKLNGALYTTGSVPVCQAPGLISLEVTTAMTNYLFDVTYSWEYNIGGETFENWVPNPAACPGFCDDIAPGDPRPSCCDEPLLIPEVPAPLLWRTIGGTTTASVNAGRKEIMLGSLPEVNMLLENTNIVFRAAASVGILTTNGIQSNILFVAPAPPTATLGQAAASCTVSNTGSVLVSDITGSFDTYRYLLKNGIVTDAECDPSIDGSCLQPNDITGVVSSTNLNIQNVSPGWHTLFLMNNAGMQGFCPRRIGEVVVPEVPALAMTVFSSSDVLCQGGHDGTITTTIEGGQHDNVSYTLTNTSTFNTLNSTTNVPSASHSFNNLLPGNHHLVISDHCTNPVTRDIRISQPHRLFISSFEKTETTCIDPSDGTMQLQVTRSSGPFEIDTSPLIRYVLFKDGLPLHFVESGNTTYDVNNLPPSDHYLVMAIEVGVNLCNATSQSFTVSSTQPIGISDLIINQPTCFGSDDASIKLNGTGRSGYQYTMVADEGFIEKNTTGEFTSLQSGTYQLTVSAEDGCNDVFVYPESITVAKPPQLSVTINKTDITCYGQDNGTLSAQISGGNPDFIYTWETQLTSGWATLGFSGHNIAHFGSGSFRLRIEDANECTAISNTVTVNEPEEVRITGITIKDVVCFGDQGSITLAATGGTGDHDFLLQPDDQSFVTFEPGQLLDAGRYSIKVVDANGCETPAEDVFIRSPDRPLTVSDSLSIYSSFNVSCFGANDGTVFITASGGNGGSYNRYQYRIETQEQPGPYFTGIKAGTYSFAVTDGRGCEVMKQITFTQPEQNLHTALTAHQDVACFGDATGFIEVTGVGGTPPYRYQFEETGTLSDVSHFGGLRAGIYEVTVTDNNNCTDTDEYVIAPQHPPINVTADIRNVSCFGSSDGSILLHLAGGVEPFQYRWNNGMTANALQNLAPGNYTISVTDAAGCVTEENMMITAPPDELRVDVMTKPVCYGNTEGVIQLMPSGGTPPYQYSINNGVRYQSGGVFPATPGNHDVVIKDNNNCSITDLAVVPIRNEKPEPNFLVATTREASDTLTIVDVSVPKPDSIHWRFDPAAIVVANDRWSPQIQFLKAGNFQVTMTGYFGGCDYTITKPLDVTVKETQVIPSGKHRRQIENIIVSPNPGNGVFNVSVTLNGTHRVNLEVMNTLGIRHHAVQWPPTKNVTHRIDLSNQAPGAYLMRVVTDGDASDVRIILQR